MDASLLSLLRSVIDRIVPEDADSGALDAGTDRFVSQMLDGDASALAPAIEAGLRDLAAAPAFAGAGSADERDQALVAVSGSEWFRNLVELTADGFYADPDNGGNADAVSWRMIGYEHRLQQGGSGPPRRAPPPPRSMPPDKAYDAIVVGAGAGGGVAAAVLAEAGLRVLVLERGRERSFADSGHRDHLRNHRAAIWGHNTGPDLKGEPRVVVDPSGTAQIVPPNDLRYSNNASCVGSGTLLYGGMAWRFLPDDFRMASLYGVPEGSSLTDWPITYDDLEPWYDRVEWEIGVAGDSSGNPLQGPRQRPYPMPPVPGYAAAETLKAGAKTLGWATFAPPLLINTVPRDGRGACIECGSCVGFPCPSNGKNGTQNTMIPRALATGYCDLRTETFVERIDTDAHGRVTGVTYVTDGAEPRRTTVRARAVVVAASAVETARLLLLSRSAAHPDGLGNAHDLVGRNLQGHFYPVVYGLFDQEVYDPRGPGVTIATCEFNHGNSGIVGGALLADDFILLPSIFFRLALPPDLRRWGWEAKDFMRRNYRRVMQVRGPIHEIPSPEARVTLDPKVVDRRGLSVARLSGTMHPETLRTAAFIREKSLAWLKASGAVQTWSAPIVTRLSAGQHQAGTCRMGNDPLLSVTDPFGRIWGHDNLVICDGSLHPTNGGFNPVLTIMALAYRNADRLARDLGGSPVDQRWSNTAASEARVGMVGRYSSPTGPS